MITPSIDKQAFSCPHCGAIAHQDWFEVFASRLSGGNDGTPKFFDEQLIDDAEATASAGEEGQGVRNMVKIARREIAGEVFIWGKEEGHYARPVANVHLAGCFSCKKYSLWVAAQQNWPLPVFEIAPSPDMPTEIRADFDEARAVLSASPRAACALLRTAIERLCNFINDSEDRVFDGIGKLVEKGLDSRIQKALDVVRVTGNNAVHPKQIS